MVATATPKKAVVPTKADWLFGLVGDGVGVESKSGEESLLPSTSNSSRNDGEGDAVVVFVTVAVGDSVGEVVIVGVGVSAKGGFATLGVEVGVGVLVGV